MGEYAEAFLRQSDKVKITDQSEALFKQRRWSKTKTNDSVASRLEMGLKILTARAKSEKWEDNEGLKLYLGTIATANALLKTKYTREWARNIPQ